MQSLVSSSRRGDGHLWMIALGLSVAINLALLLGLGFAALQSALLRKQTSAATPKAPPAESVAMIFPDFAKAVVAPERPQAVERRQARTTPDQAAEPEKTPLFQGERNTRATSDRAPRPDAAPLPSQAGITPRDETDIETTESRYQDGVLADQAKAAAPPSEPTPPQETPAREMTDTPAAEAVKATLPPPRETLLDGPNPVEVPVPRETAPTKEIKPTPEKRAIAETPPAPKAEPKKPAEPPKPKASTDPAFKGYQRKTAVMGSISRTGRSALDVADTPLGRYQAAISRAVELEWQRNCVRHRDFITPGFLTVRFFVEISGKVRSVEFVGDMETGEVQKGFTLNSIRDAEIPSMPAALRKEYDKEPLELIFRFYF